jgi:hypothetical protein
MIVFVFFIVTLLSSLSANVFVTSDNNLASAKKSSHTSVGDSNDTGNGDIVSNKGSNGDGGSSGRTTTTRSKDQGNTDLSSTTSSASTTTPTSQQQQPDNSNCNTTLMIGCVTGSSVQCIVAPCGPSSTTSTNADNSNNDSVTGGSVQCIVAPCGPSSTTSTNGSPLTPQQQYQQCASGIGGGIPGNCSPPPTNTTAQQNFAPQTITPQNCKLPPIGANGDCQRIDMKGGSMVLPPPFQSGSQEKQQAHYTLPKDVIFVKQLPDGSCPAYYFKMNAEYNGRACVLEGYPPNLDVSCPVGLVVISNIVGDYCAHLPVLPGTSTGSTGGGFIQLFPIPPATSPPATSPNNTSPYLPPPSTK